jgi:hypothetical protein
MEVIIKVEAEVQVGETLIIVRKNGSWKFWRLSGSCAKTDN